MNWMESDHALLNWNQSESWDAKKFQYRIDADKQSSLVSTLSFSHIWTIALHLQIIFIPKQQRESELMESWRL